MIKINTFKDINNFLLILVEKVNFTFSDCDNVLLQDIVKCDICFNKKLGTSIFLETCFINNLIVKHCNNDNNRMIQNYIDHISMSVRLYDVNSNNEFTAEIDVDCKMEINELRLTVDRDHIEGMSLEITEVEQR